MSAQAISPAVEQSANIVQINDNAALMAAVARAAADPQIDVEKMERLFAMHERMEARAAEQAFNGALASAQSEMPLIQKDRHNSQTSSDYATLDAINARIVPIYTRHGLALSFDTTDSPLADHVRVVCRVTHTSGHSQTYTHDNPLDMTGIGGKVNKTLTHGRGSAITYARRYLTMLIFNLRTGYDDDGNAVGQGSDITAWRDAIAGAVDRTELDALAKEVQAANLPQAALRNVRALWAAKAKELAA